MILDMKIKISVFRSDYQVWIKILFDKPSWRLTIWTGRILIWKESRTVSDSKATRDWCHSGCRNCSTRFSFRFFSIIVNSNKNLNSDFDREFYTEFEFMMIEQTTLHKMRRPSALCDLPLPRYNRCKKGNNTIFLLFCVKTVLCVSCNDYISVREGRAELGDISFFTELFTLSSEVLYEVFDSWILEAEWYPLIKLKLPILLCLLFVRS
jgi:hypothetical protein